MGLARTKNLKQIYNCIYSHLLARQISNMDKRVVEAGIDVRHTKHILAFLCLWAEYNLFLLNGLSLSGCHLKSKTKQ